MARPSGWRHTVARTTPTDLASRISPWVTSGRPAEEGQEKHHRDHDEVLINQDAQGIHSLRRLHFRPVLKEFHDDGGAAQGREEPDEDSLSPGWPRA